MSSGPKQIMIVEDDPSTRQSLEILLTKAGYDVIQAQNGSEAVQLWRSLGADLVILDLYMPEKDGIETIVELRRHSPGIRIIAMSGGGMYSKPIHLLEDARLLGAVLTIAKPFTATEMLAIVNQALAP